LRFWEWWGEIRAAVKMSYQDWGKLISFSPVVEIEGKIVALTVIFSQADCMSYPSMSMSVFEAHGRWPSLQFGAMEAILN